MSVDGEIKRKRRWITYLGVSHLIGGVWVYYLFFSYMSELVRT